jgi:hypothetical protein
MNVLHISHHIGCFKDQAYVLKKLGFDLLSFKFYDNLFCVDHQVANDFWVSHKDTINSYDYVLISDTAPISRCILQNIDEFKSKLIIWICNRFDYAMQNQPEYYQLFDQYKNHAQVKIVASTFWEKIWCLKNNIDILDCPVINPIGKFDKNLECYIPNSNVYEEWYNINTDTSYADIFVPFYHNDNVFTNLKQRLQNMNLSACSSTFTSINQLKQYKAVITLPDTFCKWFSFEAIHEIIPILLPSKKLLLQLCKQPGYIFNMTGYGGAENMTEDLIDVCEWYKPSFAKCRHYFDSFEDIPRLLYNIYNEEFISNFRQCSKTHEDINLNKWKELYASF